MYARALMGVRPTGTTILSDSILGAQASRNFSKKKKGRKGRSDTEATQTEEEHSEIKRSEPKPAETESVKQEEKTTR